MLGIYKYYKHQFAHCLIIHQLAIQRHRRCMLAVTATKAIGLLQITGGIFYVSNSLWNLYSVEITRNYKVFRSTNTLKLYQFPNISLLVVLINITVSIRPLFNYPSICNPETLVFKWYGIYSLLNHYLCEKYLFSSKQHTNKRDVE